MSNEAKPVRVQLSRHKGWRMPEHTLKVCRPSKWGNPFPIGKVGALGKVAPDRASSVGMFRAMLADAKMREAAGYPSDAEIRAELSGKNLACWCPLGGPCHADALLDIANSQDASSSSKTMV